MKQGKALITFVIASLAVTLAIYMGFYAFRSFNDPYQTTRVYSYTAYDSVAADGLLVREELVLPAQPGIVELVRSEGEKVGVGQQVALVHRDSQAQADQAQIHALESEITLLEYALGAGVGAETGARLDEDILQSMVKLRASSALGDYNDLEDQVIAVKSGILRRSYTYGDGVSSADLTAQLRELNSQLAALNQRSALATSAITASQAGIFSGLVDGYESQLTPSGVLQLTPSTLQSLMDNPASGIQSHTGKLITSDRWWFASNLPADAAQRLTQGGSAMLRFTGDFSQDVEMRVDLIGPTEGKTTLVVFSADRYLARTTLLRRQTAELIFESSSGLRIPKSALRIVEYSYEDEETKELIQANKLGVYTLVNRRTEFKEVEIVTEGSDYYVVRPVGTGRKILRPGDEVITQATNLQDGQLWEY